MEQHEIQEKAGRQDLATSFSNIDSPTMTSSKYACKKSLCLDINHLARFHPNSAQCDILFCLALC